MKELTIKNLYVALCLYTPKRVRDVLNSFFPGLLREPIPVYVTPRRENSVRNHF